MVTKNNKKDPNYSVDQAKYLLWQMGDLSWKLTPVQKEIKKSIETDETRTSVVVASRRLGKSYLLVTLALEQCYRQANSIVKILFPHQKDAKKNLDPLFREVLEDCPKDLRPRFDKADLVYYFPNGSVIQLAGSDNGNVESIRGGKAHLCIVDEAGFCSDLTYSIRSVLSPTIRTTGGRLVLASTPSRSPSHEFITNFVTPYKAANRLKVYTIHDNPNFDDRIIEEILADYPARDQDPDFRREYLCEVMVDEETAVCPEFTKNESIVVLPEDQWPDLPPYCDFYVGMDIGFKDLTVALFGYYDFKQATLYIQDELVINGPEMTTDRLAQEIKHKETLRFYRKDLDSNEDPFLRIMDLDLKLQNDLLRLHNLQFMCTEKQNLNSAINQMRIWVGHGRIRIHERCKTLIYHLKYAQWTQRSDSDKTRKLARLPDTPDKMVRGGHADAVPALYYLIRNINEYHNPYPESYDRVPMANRHQSSRYDQKTDGWGALAKALTRFRKD